MLVELDSKEIEKLLTALRHANACLKNDMMFEIEGISIKRKIIYQSNIIDNEILIRKLSNLISETSVTNDAIL